ncbi:uncharacterized protein LOC130630496 [Hydractinia symbiolongicarpus]|uniref:uncharacterized protein LOC130630496 n=1 Tax=Hydractinia symbiolongicarpus TaxID=13093 RepID=UPI00254A1DDD|nr:uncharacterized protein LOC130630496 [Hydractinia symbiolongicarpus]XP_057299999.1 uncharacterized protein LOC130630496 [Hydractinia symbiolongicarpus]
MGLKNCLMRLMAREGATPLPTAVLLVLFYLLLLDGMTLTTVFSFLPKLVKSFGTSEVETGLYAGMIASSIYVGRMIFSLPWGYVADVKGKRSALIVSTTLLMFSTLVFGFTNSFYWAIITRFIQGASSAIIVISKSILADVCDDTNLTLAMSIAFTSSSIGFIIGPSLAGFLVFPCQQYPDFFQEGSFFERFGIFLPNLILTIGLAISILLIMVYVPNVSRENNERTLLLKASVHKCQYGSSTKIKDKNLEKNIVQQINETEDAKGCLEKLKTFKIVKLLRVKECIQVSLLYGIYSIAAIGSEELFPLFASTAREYNGMVYSTSKIGLTLLIVAVLILPTQFLFLPKITEHFGSRKVFIGSNLFSAFLFPWLPVLVGIVSNSTGLWMAVVFILILLRLCLIGGFIGVNILLNNTVPSDLLGSANGFAMTLSSFGRCVAPAVLGSLYSWSLTNIKRVSSSTDSIGFPFNQFFTFYVVSVLFILNSVFASTISPVLDNRKF